MDERQLKQALQLAVRKAHAPGAVAFVGDLENTYLHEAEGYRQISPTKLPATRDTIYDLASLTKVVATTTAIMLLRDAGKLRLDQPVSELVPMPAFRVFTVRQLLTHTGGLPAFKPWYTEVSGTAAMLDRIAGLELGRAPGSYRRYSDLGFIVLGKVVELVARQPLDVFCRGHIFAPLGMDDTGFNPTPGMRERCAATEKCNWRKKIIVGEVHDETASAMGGVSGHAGLFAPAADLAKFCRALLGGRLLRPATVAEMTRLGQLPYYPWQGLGWKMDPWLDSSEGYLPAREALGHTGWTGTSIWMDQTRGLFSILLSNTCHPSRQRRYNKTLRQTFHVGLARAAYPAQANTHTGLDRIMRDNYDPLRGKAIGLLANSAAVDALGRPVVRVLALERDVEIKRLFSPEHGFAVQAEAGEHVATQTMANAGKVISLYGDRKAPSAQELSGLDYFVVDLPDVGARYYTYMATMKRCMEACAKAKTPMLVLDRPNPVGGEILEGPIAAVTDSDVCCAPMPIRHGMTLGELALFFERQFFVKSGLKLTVLTMDNWPRELLFPETGLPWVPPSPNIPTPETALVYIGTCLFEGANLNEGRGTPTPFFLVGAPWLDAETVAASVPEGALRGFRIEPVTYTPTAIPGKASNPKYRDTACRGIRIHITQPAACRPFTLAFALLQAIRQKHGSQLELSPFFDTLAGGPWLRGQLEQGVPAEAMAARIASSLGAFAATRPKRYETGSEIAQSVLYG